MYIHMREWERVSEWVRERERERERKKELTDEHKW
jgi:hypothetical protein